MALNRDMRGQDRLLERTEEKLRGSNEPLAKLRSAPPANMQNVEALTKANGHQPKATKTENQELQARTARALSLRRRYPDMKDIPADISKQQRKKLLQNYEQGKTSKGLPNQGLPAGASAANQPTKPKTHEAKKGKKKRSAQAKAKPSGKVANNVSGSNAANQAARPISDGHKRASRGAPPRTKQHGTSQNPNVVSQPSNKMAPLSDERRAEVVRNLKGYTHSDPINID